MFEYDSALKLEDINGATNTKILNHIKKTKSYLEGLRTGEELKKTMLKDAQGQGMGKTQISGMNMMHGKQQIGRSGSPTVMNHGDIKEEDSHDDSDEKENEQDSNGDSDKVSPIKSGGFQKIDSDDEKSSDDDGINEKQNTKRIYFNAESNPSIADSPLLGGGGQNEDQFSKFVQPVENMGISRPLKTSLFSPGVGGNTLSPNLKPSKKTNLLIPPIQPGK